MAHLKRYMIPGFWPVRKKENTFSIRPMTGPHPKDNCIPLQIVLRDVLKYAESAKEAKSMLSQGKVLVDKKARKDPKFPVGLMDVLEMPDANKYFRVGVNHKGLSLREIGEGDSKKKLCRINGKTTIKKGKTQINLHDGRNIIVDKDVYSVGDTVVISIPDQKILKHHVFHKGENAIVIAGKNIGVKGKIVDIRKRKNMLEKTIVVIDSKGGEIQTLRDYILVGEI